MAHEIEGNKMIYVGAKPWHDRGRQVEIPAGLPPQEAIALAMKLASLDFTVSRVRLQMPAARVNDADEVITDGRLVDAYAVIRNTDSAVLGVVGPEWREVQNAKAFSPLSPFLAAGCTIETAGCLFSGARVWMLLKVGTPDSVIDARTDDRVSKYVVAAVGHDGKLSFTLGYTPIRVVCNNTLSVALGRGESTHVRIRHTAGANAAIDALKDTIEQIDARFEQTAEVFRALAGKEIHNAEQLHAYIDAVFPPAKKKDAPAPEATPAPETLADLLAKPRTPNLIGTPAPTFVGTPAFVDAANTPAPEATSRRMYGTIENLLDTGRGHRPAGAPLTLWHAYNAVTEYNTWERGRSVDNRLNNLWLAQPAAVANALPAAVEMLKAA